MGASIYGSHSYSDTLSIEENNIIARKLLGLNQGYYAQNQGSASCCDYRVGRMLNGSFITLRGSTELLDKLKR